jgi:hypothetical protein
MLNDNKPQELLTVQGSVPQSYYDDRYIEAYTDNPLAGKSAALSKAGYIGDYLAQEAHRIHKRLAPKIREIIEARAVEGISVGHSVMMELAKESDSDNVRGAMAKGLIEYGERIQLATRSNEDSMSMEQIDAELALLERPSV